MLNSFLLEVATGQDYDQETYDGAAGALLAKLATLLSDTATLRELTYNAELTSAHSSIEVSLDGEPRELIARVVLDLTSDAKVRFDKTKWSKRIREAYSEARCSKRQVPTVEA